MSLIEKIIRFFRPDSFEEEDFDTEDWNHVVYARDDRKINNKEQRDEYVRGCLEQIADATKELENLQFEYNMVTSYLRDMEEIEALPPEEMEVLLEAAKKIDGIEEQKSSFLAKKDRMSDGQFHQMSRIEEEAAEGCEKLKEAEEYQQKIKSDLRRLDGEFQAYLFRRGELKRLISDSRGMILVILIATLLCVGLLSLLRFGFGKDTGIGFLVLIALAAISITVVFTKHNDAVSELGVVEHSMNKIILLQNRVKIRYVNNTNLLDYLYAKYEVQSAGELIKMWKRYQNEKEERDSFRQAEKDLSQYQREFMHELRRFQVKDPDIWLHQTSALYDKKEMVEIRHNLIIRRQSLRSRMDYNREVIAAKAQNEIKDLVESYPKYAREIMGIVDEYDKDYN